MLETNQGEPNQQPGTIVAADPPAESPRPVPITVAALIAVGATAGKDHRKALAKKIYEGNRPSRFPNAVELEVDRAALLNERFIADALFELRERPGVLMSGDDSHVFEAMAVETLRTEASDLFDLLNAEIEGTDASKQVLVASSEPIVLTGADGKTKEPYHLVRLSKVRAYVERTGIALDLPKVAVPQPVPAGVEPE